MTLNSSADKNLPAAISPHFAIGWRDIYDFLGEFGPYKGRYVARYPEAWMGDLRERIGEFAAEKLGPVGLQALKRKFEELDLCLVREKKWGWEDSKTWEGNARDAIASDAVSVIIGNALDPAPFGDWLSTLPRIRDTSRHSWLFRGRVSDYIDAIRPLLLNSPAAYFIDPYLDPLSDDCENLLLLIFDLIKGSKCYSIELMVRQCAFNKRDVLSPKTWMPCTEIERRLREIYSEKIPASRSLIVHLVEGGTYGSDDMDNHDRFFLTRFGGINFGRGFMFSESKFRQRSAFVLDKDHHKAAWEIYSEGVARFHEAGPKKPTMPHPLSVETIKLSSLR